MFILMVVIFVLGYTAIALEHPIRVDKAASALLIGVLTWVVFVVGSADILPQNEACQEYLKHHPQDSFLDYITHNQILRHLGEISEILFFLLGAMTIVEIVDQHNGFKIITDKIKTTKKVKLLWILTVLTFFMSAALDNLTTTIVLVALLRKLVADKKDRWLFASMVVVAANAGGAWSPIGDVTTIMLWVKGQVTTWPIIRDVFVPSVVSSVVPALVLSFFLKGNVNRPQITEEVGPEPTKSWERNFILILGVGSLLFVPVFKLLTHLPPYMGMLQGLAILWIVTELMHKKKDHAIRSRLSVVGILRKVDVPTVLFFLGILSAVAALQSAGHLGLLADWLDDATGRNIYTINIAIGALSSIVDNVPLVAGAMGMYEVHPELLNHLTPETLATLQSLGEGASLASVSPEMLPNYSPEMISMVQELKPDQYKALMEISQENLEVSRHFVHDGNFWQFLAYCAGTGGSMLIIGSAAGVAAMGMEKIDFIWYLKKISILALLGYLAGAGTYYLMFGM